ncbi:hypothetical protein B0T16DRAFT_459846 [Cercophora newfieldiana]|uniref:Uncharacterized protein n=1 Tax=Cercophora newfieldiana TaxID=92897 RepID=A0AA39Y0X9_9PEZI|nr:hypothetical protein B0T16DRAFT_459846 [Cercophora newfieldiana]
MLSTCPVEIAELILDDLCRHHRNGVKEYYPYWYDDKPDDGPAPIELEAITCLTALAHLRQTSKRLCHLATWRLFHTLPAVTTGRKWWMVARTLLERPDLSRLVKHMSLGHKLSFPSSIPGKVTAYYQKQVATVVPYDTKWDRDLERQDPDIMNWGFAVDEEGILTLDDLADKPDEENNAPLAILVSLCPDLEALEFIARNTAMPFNFCQPGSLASLRSIYACWEGWETGYDIATLRLLLLAAPNLELLYFRGPRSCSRLADSMTPVKLEKVTVVQVAMGSLDRPSLVALLRLCPNMQSLRYSSTTSINPDQFTPVDGANAITIYGNPNLKHFELEVTDWCDFEEFQDDDLLEAKSILEKQGINHAKYTCNSNRVWIWEATRVCRLAISSGQTWPAVNEISTNGAGETVIGTVNSESYTAEDALRAINAYGIIMKYKKADFGFNGTLPPEPARIITATALLLIKLALAQTSSSSTVATSTTNTPTQSNSANSSANGPGLSSGAIAGIAIGAVAGVGLFVALGWIVFIMGKRRGANNAVNPEATPVPEAVGGPSAEARVKSWDARDSAGTGPGGGG